MNRGADIALALALGLLLAPVILAVALAVRLVDGAPVLFLSRRLSRHGRAFRLVKFRTMRGADTEGVTGGDKAGRITRLGAWLRRSRLDELPQLWNILSGDIGFVGPRPPLPEVAASAPALYARVLASRPGVTGLATLVFAGREEGILARARTGEETSALYLRRCVPRKARVDLIHARRRSLGLDLWLMALTALRVATAPRGRLPRRRRG